ncbi:hypothetical protein DEU56DRAFT_753675 [Suillus clintonianus]|uniref:uncharacterized protein n=1 Tax=Suillus clintonianus TaxID=1904413 RepID=UPI001B86086A|nr:uncharacterized protein DEU56DRAFT_753675 [Suillus clintonianus]KAG2146810.1 hypothetical protein DEU56DRAFT_753675 [Suillus clintonianus]
MPQQRLQPLSPLSPSFSSTYWIPSSAECPSAGAYTSFEGFSSARQHSTSESLSADGFTASFDTFAPPQTRTSGKICPGTYITFRLATEEIAQQYPEDSEIHRRIREYNPGRYLGLVTASLVHWNEEDGSTCEDVIVHFVSRDTPLPSLAVVEDFFIPISSTVTNDRSDLQTKILFPWTDYKQWTTFGVRLRVCRTNQSALVFELCNEDFERFEDKAGEDYTRLESVHAKLDDEAKDTLAKLSVASFALPAEIWLDIRNHPNTKEPLSLLGDVASLESILAGNMPSDHESSALDEE